MWVSLSVMFVLYFKSIDLETSFQYAGTSSEYLGHRVKVKVTGTKGHILIFTGGRPSIRRQSCVRNVQENFEAHKTCYRCQYSFMISLRADYLLLGNLRAM